MVGCPSENPTTAELFSGWQIYIPHYIPSRFILKNRVYVFDGVSFEGRLLSENSNNISDEQGNTHYQFIEFEESKLNSDKYYHPCIEKNLTQCTLYLTTKGGKRIDIDSKDYDKGTTVFNIVIDNTYIKISKWGKDSPILTESELVNVVDSFMPVSLSEFENKVPAY